MANSHVVVDTSIIIDHLRKRNKQDSHLSRIVGVYALYLPSIVLFELFAGANSSRKHDDIENILALFRPIAFDGTIARQAAAIYRLLKEKNQVIEIRDIFIGASAMTLDLPLASLNKDHFQRIESLRLLRLP